MSLAMSITLALTLEEIILGVSVAFTIGLLIVFNLIGPVLSLYILARVSGAHVSLFELVRMSRRRERVRDIVLNRIRLHKAGITDVRLDDLRAHAAAGGDVKLVATAMIAAKDLKQQATWSKVAAADLAEIQDVLAVPSRELTERLSGIIGSRAVARSPVLPIYMGQVTLNSKVYRARASGIPIPEGAEVEVTGFRSSGTLVVNYLP